MKKRKKGTSGLGERGGGGRKEWVATYCIIYIHPNLQIFIIFANVILREPMYYWYLLRFFNLLRWLYRST